MGNIQLQMSTSKVALLFPILHSIPYNFRDDAPGLGDGLTDDSISFG